MPDRVSIGGLNQMAQQSQQPSSANSILQNMYKGVDFSSPSPMQQPRPMQMGPQRRRLPPEYMQFMQQIQQPQFDDSVFGKGYFDRENFSFGNESQMLQPQIAQQVQSQNSQIPDMTKYLRNTSPTMQLSPLERYAQYQKMGLIK